MNENKTPQEWFNEAVVKNAEYRKSQYKTLKEWFGDATRGDGRKFIEGDDSEFFWFEPFFKDANSYWHVLSQNGLHHVEDENDVFKLWHPPKKKKKLWLWASNTTGKDGITEYMVTEHFYSDEDVKKDIHHCRDWIKLEHTMIEVDE